MRAPAATAAMWGLLTCAGVVLGQVPTSFDVADMTEGRDPAKEARRHLANAEKAMRKVMKLEAKSSEAGSPDLREKILKSADRAANEAQKAVALDPLLVEVRVVQGNALLRLGEAEGAVDACSTAVRRRPGFTEARLCLARAYLDLGRPRKAVETYEDLARSDAEPARELLPAFQDWLARHPDAPDHAWLQDWLHRSSDP